jgi:hypothetical protein
MNKKNLDQALAALSDALTSQEPESLLNNPLVFIEKIPKRSLSGDHIYKGKILGFSSAGITDQASKEQILITDSSVKVSTLTVDTVEGNLNVAGDVIARTLKADILEVKEIKADIKFEKDSNIPFNGPNKGLIWTGTGPTRQLTFQVNPDRFFASDTIDLQKGKYFSVNGVKVIDDVELGPSVTKSNLREVGRLNGLIVDGSFSVNQYLYYNATADRLGLGTEEPNAAFSIAEDMIEVMIGTRDSVNGIVGTFASHSFDLVTDNTTRISIGANGDLQFGNTKKPPIQVSIHGKLAVKVNMPDPEVDLHVNGAIKFNGKLHKYAATHPIAGAYNAGDIVWNTEPKVNNFVGWVCVQAGDPGIWAPFGKIGT